ncbi:hypothetical protein AB1Y20_018216 [Prymnesium parvum]|uniref:Uncharacterized protein n=1 Tax=Prymnesium parvum TaxID=97485 RepID=A0AB34JMZ4_PRYPA
MWVDCAVAAMVAVDWKVAREYVATVVERLVKARMARATAHKVAKRGAQEMVVAFEGKAGEIVAALLVLVLLGVGVEGRSCPRSNQCNCIQGFSKIASSSLQNAVDHMLREVNLSCIAGNMHLQLDGMGGKQAVMEVSMERVEEQVAAVAAVAAVGTVLLVEVAKVMVRAAKAEMKAKVARAAKVVSGSMLSNRSKKNHEGNHN